MRKVLSVLTTTTTKIRFMVNSPLWAPLLLLQILNIKLTMANVYSSSMLADHRQNCLTILFRYSVLLINISRRELLFTVSNLPSCSSESDYSDSMIHGWWSSRCQCSLSDRVESSEVEPDRIRNLSRRCRLRQDVHWIYCCHPIWSVFLVPVLLQRSVIH